MSEHPDEHKVAEATRALELLNAQADRVRAELLGLRQDLANVQLEFSEARGAQLLEANEQLVLAAMHAESIAQAAVSNLGELARVSQRDVLTDTPNRTLMLDRLENSITLARRHGTRIAVLFVDLDHFKEINDTLGHLIGDDVLRLVARGLESVVRDSDTVGRHGGDEFLVLLTEVAQVSDASLIARKMLNSLAEPCTIEGHVLILSASIGIAIYPEDGDEALTLIGRADAAMYRSKRQGPGNFEFYSQAAAGDGGPESSTASVLRQLAERDAAAASAGHEAQLADLREANAQLVMAALTAQEMETRAEEAHHRQVKFLAMVVHELRNPLAPIRNAAELLQRARTDEPLLTRLQVIIKRQVAHMSRLVDDLLDGARVSTGKFRLDFNTVQIGDVLSIAVEACRPAMEARHQKFEMLTPASLFSVRADPVRLAQIFSNLLDNASKYTQEGGQITLSVVAQGHTIVATVSDNGIGITAEALPLIFDLFVQDARALAVHRGGLGIGLAVVRDLVEAHGGTVTGSSAGKDFGSDFVVTLPMIDSGFVAG